MGNDPQIGKDAETSVRKRGRPRVASDDERRGKIAAVARQTFLELGYGPTTIDLLAKRCGISKQTFYRLFSNKSEILIAMIEAHNKTMLNLPRDPNEALSLEETLIEIFRTDVDEKLGKERDDFTFFFFSEAYQYPEILTLLRTYGAERSRRDLAGWLESRQVRGDLEIEDSLRAAGMLMGMVFGPMSNPAYKVGEPVTMEMRNKHVQTCVEIFLHGVAVQKHSAWARLSQL
ncbi:TetR/AcrR family transcriptional regulator [Rhizobium sp. AG207R]|uniref:TetR/AcrR family transcriptional regulator n=1 Tax=Rhizobium sp. AG207R TaxID=2802287 RepID=UPI0022ABF8B3|nr:TetR/AcrR family transcriptional regulator [Rhizobium sp. AG207R]